MTRTKRRPMTDEEREQKRAADRELVMQSVEQLRSTEGWQRWLRSRSHFHNYSVGNQLLIAMQSSWLLEKGLIEKMPTRVAGFKKWLGMGYCVSKRPEGAKAWALKIWMPAEPTKKQIAEAKEKGEKVPKIFFVLGSVFGDPQVSELPEFDEEKRIPLAPPITDIEGDDLAEHFVPLVKLAEHYECPVEYEKITDGSLGFYVPSENRIALKLGDRRGKSLAPNQTIATLIHETAHMLVRKDKLNDDPEMTYAEEELVVESVAMSVCGSLGLDTSSFSIPYLTSWSERTPIETIESYAKLVNRLATIIEKAVEA
jgi:antirestriction protein ArdC